MCIQGGTDGILKVSTPLSQPRRECMDVSSQSFSVNKRMTSVSGSRCLPSHTTNSAIFMHSNPALPACIDTPVHTDISIRWNECP